MNKKTDFEEKYNFPQIVAFLDGSQISIRASFKIKEDYFNREQYYTVNLYDIVNSSMGFMHGNVYFGMCVCVCVCVGGGGVM